MMGNMQSNPIVQTLNQKMASSQNIRQNPAQLLKMFADFKRQNAGMDPAVLLNQFMAEGKLTKEMYEKYARDAKAIEALLT